MAARKIGALLAASELQTLSRKAARLTEIQQTFVNSAPAPLARTCQVKDYRAGTLFLSAENAAVAVKLRQLAPTLLSRIRKREPEITGIRIGVQVKEVTPVTQVRAKKRALTSENIEVFRRLSETLPESSLKAALVNLVRRHDR